MRPPVFTGRAKGPGGGLGTQRERSARFAQRLTSHPPPLHRRPKCLKWNAFTPLAFMPSLRAFNKNQPIRAQSERKWPIRQQRQTTDTIENPGTEILGRILIRRLGSGFSQVDSVFLIKKSAGCVHRVRTRLCNFHGKRSRPGKTPTPNVGFGVGPLPSAKHKCLIHNFS